MRLIWLGVGGSRLCRCFSIIWCSLRGIMSWGLRAACRRLMIAG
jgi:hypothetical protein